MILQEEKARAGHTGDGVRMVLAASLVLAVIALVVMLGLAVN